MKKYLLITAFCAFAVLSVVAQEQTAIRTDLNKVLTSQQSASCQYADNSSTDQQTVFGKFMCDGINLVVVTGDVDRGKESSTLGVGGIVGRPIKPGKPGESGGLDVSSFDNDPIGGKFSAGGHVSILKLEDMYFPDGHGGIVGRPIKPGLLDDLVKGTTSKRNGNGTFATGHHFVSDINGDGKFGIDDVTTLIDNQLNGSSESSIGDVTELIDQLLKTR